MLPLNLMHIDVEYKHVVSGEDHVLKQIPCISVNSVFPLQCVPFY